MYFNFSKKKGKKLKENITENENSIFQKGAKFD
jgi:hypothetical protein